MSRSPNTHAQLGLYQGHARAHSARALLRYLCERRQRRCERSLKAGVAQPAEALLLLRASLRSGDHGDDAVKAAATAMRHSSKMQASATYDKGGSDRRVMLQLKSKF